MKLKQRNLNKKRRNPNQRRNLNKRRNPLSLQPHLHPLHKRKSRMQMLSLNHLQLCTEEPLMSLWSLVCLHHLQQEKERSLKLKLKRRKGNKWCFGLCFCWIRRASVTWLLGTKYKSRGYSRKNLSQLLFFFLSSPEATGQICILTSEPWAWRENSCCNRN